MSSMKDLRSKSRTILSTSLYPSSETKHDSSRLLKECADRLPTVNTWSNYEACCCCSWSPPTILNWEVGWTNWTYRTGAIFRHKNFSGHTLWSMNHNKVKWLVYYKHNFFPFCPPHKKLVREKLPNYILGLAMSRLLKWPELLFFFNQWWSGDPDTYSSDSSLET